jgi:hypothetical protein
LGYPRLLAGAGPHDLAAGGKGRCAQAQGTAAACRRKMMEPPDIRFLPPKEARECDFKVITCQTRLKVNLGAGFSENMG